MATTAVVAITALVDRGNSDRPTRPAPPLAAATAATTAQWTALGTVPGAQRDFTRAELLIVSGEPYVAVIERRSGGRGPQRAEVWAWHNHTWHGPIGGRRFSVDPSSRFILADAGALCAAWQYAARPNLACMSEHNMWHALPKPASWTSLSRIVNLFAIGEQLYVQAATQSRTGLVRGVPAVFRRDGTAWSSVANRPAQAPRGGSQRFQPFEYGGDPCLAYDHVTSSTALPTVRLECARNGSWQPVAPAITGATIDAPRAVVNIDGIEVAGGKLYAGVDRFEQSGAGWEVLRLADSRWVLTSLETDSPPWSAQGALCSVGRQLWALRFDQQLGRAGPIARFEVDVLDTRSGAVTRQVGGPLLRARQLYGPVSYGLGAARSRIYALWTEPVRHTRANRLRLSVLSV